ncbi:cytochrome c [Pseudomonas sp. BN414]|uniref:Cytochrome c n=1 Tax=Metapseudomonas resinovorans TaxID=53412 RepID=A0ABT4Y4N5_METRE|nr:MULTISPECIES: cytochrome c [Pseudomonas]MBD2838638.1 cytochrome c [Pseudomonas sp. JM0905a]MDA8483825.1 cytochrome c [Pseudomonas resinovorans]MDH4560036.1 cytochrome c [Pseudomonas sp. BN411]MDH4567184.1 cytochrome c [Pseudomonas sp. BN414]MDH4870996.1 cytochrome c [Pseudomonas sp. BN515]
MSSLLNSQAVKRPLLASLALPFALLAGQAFADGDGVWKSGENVYQKVCGHCHEHQVGPVITGRQLPPQYISAVVRNGFRAMPAFPASFIDDKALQQVGEYISKSPAPAAKP